MNKKELGNGKYKNFTDKQRRHLISSVEKAMEILDCATNEEFARKINVAYSTPGFWRRGQKGVSFLIANKIQKLTKGKVTVFDLVPDLHNYEID